MEIADYLRIARRRVWLLIGVPLIAAALTAALIMLSPTTYTATSTVSAPALIGGTGSNQFSGTQAISMFAAQFSATSHLPSVVNAVAAQTKVPASDIVDNSTVAQVGASSVMTVTFTYPKESAVAPVVKSLTSETLRTMFDSQVALSEAQLQSAEQSVAQANSAIVAWEKTNGMVDPTLVYQASLQRLNSLTQQWATQSANGSSAGAAALSGAISSLKQELPKFGPLLASYGQLTAARDAAVASVNQNQQQVSQARAQASAADPGRTAYVTATAPVSKLSTLVTVGIPVTGAAFFVAVILVALLEVLSQSRTEGRDRRSVPEHHGSSGPAPTAPPEPAADVMEPAAR